VGRRESSRWAASVGTVTPQTHFARIPNTTQAALAIQARDPGLAGNEIAVLVEPHYVNSTLVQGQISTTTWVLSDVSFLEAGAPLQFELGTDREVATIQTVDAANRTVVLTGPLTGTYTPGGRVFLVGWRVTVFFRGAVVETFNGVSAVRDGVQSKRFADTLNEKSQWIRIDDSGTDPHLNMQGAQFPVFALAQAALLTGGGNGTPVDENDVVGASTPPRSGLRSLEVQDGISLIAAPGLTHQVVVSERGTAA
jgi:hypothetical protein